MKMALPKAINDLSRHHQPLEQELLDAAARVTRSGWYVLGSEVARFERAFADYCGVEHCVSVANGTDALELALRACGVAAGAKVATVANAGMYGSIALRAIGAEPLYVDVDPDSMVMSGEALARSDAQGCSAVLVTHLYGKLADMPAIQSAAARLRAPIIEDCAQAHGARTAQGIAGGFGLAGCYSFYPTKNLGALGDGGAVVTNDANYAAEVRKLRQYGWETKYKVGRPGGRNSRLDEVQAAFLLAKLPYLDRWNERRREVASGYRAAISSPHVRLPGPVDASHVAHLFIVRSRHRDELAAHLKAAHVPVDIHYPVADHRQPVWAGRYAAQRLPETEAACASVLTLPCFPEMTRDEVDAVAEAVNRFTPDRVLSVAR